MVVLYFTNEHHVRSAPHTEERLTSEVKTQISPSQRSPEELLARELLEGTEEASISHMNASSWTEGSEEVNFANEHINLKFPRKPLP